MEEVQQLMTWRFRLQVTHTHTHTHIHIHTQSEVTEVMRHFLNTAVQVKHLPVFLGSKAEFKLKHDLSEPKPSHCCQ